MSGVIDHKDMIVPEESSVLYSLVKDNDFQLAVNYIMLSYILFYLFLSLETDKSNLLLKEKRILSIN